MTAAERFATIATHPGLVSRAAALRGARLHRSMFLKVAALAIFVVAAAGAAMAQQGDRPITAAIVFLLGVTIVGALLGIWGGLAAALVASVFYNVFLVEPAFRLSLASIEDYVPLVAFNISAVASGILTGRLKDRALAAELAWRRLEVLLDLSEKLQAAVSMEQIAAAIAADDGGGFAAELYLVVDGSVRAVGPADRAAAVAARALHNRRIEYEYDWVAIPLPGAIGISSILAMANRTDEAAIDEVRAGLTNLVSISVERCLLLAQQAEAVALRKSEEFKTALLSSVSHDMRTPLVAISASASSLARYGDALDEPARTDLLETIQQQCARLNRYTTNLLSLGQLQAGLDAGRFTPCDAAEVLGAAIARIRPLSVGHRIVKRIAEAEAVVRADPVMLEQVFFNLLENSVRYSEPGGTITVSLSRFGTGIRVCVRDEGVGIPPEQLERIFDRFFRGGDRMTHGGSGLGLAIAKGFVEAFGGRIFAECPKDPAGGLAIVVELDLETPGSSR